MTWIVTLANHKGCLGTGVVDWSFCSTRHSYVIAIIANSTAWTCKGNSPNIPPNELLFRHMAVVLCTIMVD
jgi:hypothetical protein